MLYLSGESLLGRSVTDSSDGTVYEFTRDSWSNRYYCGGKLYNMDTVLGVLDLGETYVVEKPLAMLLRYIDCIDLEDTAEKYIRASYMRIIGSFGFNVFVRLSSPSYRVCSVLDIILCISYDSMFHEMLNNGVLSVQFGFTSFMRIKLCGDYYPFIMKLITMYRESFRSELVEGGYL